MTSASKRGLGKGLEALLSDNLVDGSGVMEIDISSIDSNPYQPRREFDEAKLEELSASIKEHGVIQPIIVRRAGSRFHVIAGERRLRASRMAGLKEIPAIVKEASEPEMMQLAIVENVQRQDLNPVEEAAAYKRLIDEFSMTQEELSGIVGKSRSSVANILRLNKLPSDVLELVSRETLSEGHARALLGIRSPEGQSKLAREAIKRKMSVRQLEETVARLGSIRRSRRNLKQRDPEVVRIEGLFRQGLGTKVKIKGDDKSGRIEIYYFSAEDLERIVESTVGYEK